MHAIARLRSAAAPNPREIFGKHEWKIPVAKQDLRELLSLLSILEHQLDSSMSKYESVVNEFAAETQALIELAKKIAR